MSFTLKDGLCFDDVLLSPKYNEVVNSRSRDVNLSVKWGKLEFKHPIIPANMKTIMSPSMVFTVMASGGLAIMHRFLPLEEQLEIAQTASSLFGGRSFAASIGVKDIDFNNVAKFIEAGVRIFCIDIAHGDSKSCVDMIKRIKVAYPEVFLIAGNVATGTGARRLWEAGANVVKVGVGPGSLCTTRIETGCGVPQLTALMEVSAVQKQMISLHQTKGLNIQFPFISDGGIKSAGDIVKALCFADMVMVGNVFAGCEEAPGQIISIDGRQYKEYVGSSTHKTNHIEGVAALVPVKGRYKDILTKLLEGVTSGCSYQGSPDLTALKYHPEFVRITGAGLRESHPHDVTLR